MRKDLVSIAAVFLALSAIYWFGVLLVCGEAGFPLDDAYIHLQFARHVYEGGQMAFNVGVPSSGSTAPLYPPLIAAVYSLVRNWYLASYLLGSLASLGTALAVYFILQSWTGEGRLAHWGGLLTVLLCPTVIQAFNGMEGPLYSLLFLIGLWCYANPQRRTLASLFWALGIWVRPEFLALIPILCLETALSLRGQGRRVLYRCAAELTPALAIWLFVTTAYVVYHYSQDHHFVPSTFAAKAVAPGLPKPAWFATVPGMLRAADWHYFLLAVVVWPLGILLSVVLGIAINCLPLALGLPAAIKAQWRTDRPAWRAWRFAILVLIGYPWMRGLVDNLGVYMMQQHRYFAHLAPLAVLLVVGAFPETRRVVPYAWWKWRGLADHIQQRRTLYWAGLGTFLSGVITVLSVANINTMQVAIGRWLDRHAPPDQLIAANDIGAIGFISNRPILDTVGLIEPDIIKHYLDGGTLAEYLRRRQPTYVVVFPTWYKELDQENSMLHRVFSVKLGLNVACGGSEMVVYRTQWCEPGPLARPSLTTEFD